MQALIEDPTIAKKNRNKYTKFVDQDGNWTEQTNVFVRFNEDKYNGVLRPGQKVGASVSAFGPELELGYILGNIWNDEQILFIKTAWGGTTMAVDWRPPSAPPSQHEYQQNCLVPVDGCYSLRYHDMISLVNDTLTNLPDYVPGYSMEDDSYELMSFIWFQGFNDWLDDLKIQEYEANLQHFISDVRSDLSMPDLPFMIGELGMHGSNPDENALTMRSIQQRVADTVPGCLFIETAKYVTDMSPWQSKYLLETFNKTEGYDGFHHYMGRADITIDIGRSFVLQYVSEPSAAPSPFPSRTFAPSDGPSSHPSSWPTISFAPSSSPSVSSAPSTSSSPTLSSIPTNLPTISPSFLPSQVPSLSPSIEPTFTPTITPNPTNMPSASPLPSSTPTFRVCDDDYSQLFYVEEIDDTKDCLWLGGRPEYQESYCREGRPAYDICRELCGACTDFCEDANSTSTFEYEDTPRNCAWLSIRFSVQQEVCHPGHEAYHLCPDSCNVLECEADRVIPTSVCDDHPSRTFYVEDIQASKDCVWLRDRPELWGALCHQGSEAYTICEETCGRCVDQCHDDAQAEFEIDGRKRNCEWLSIRPNAQEEVCVDGHAAWDICEETCNREKCESLVVVEPFIATTMNTAESIDFCDDGTRKFFIEETGESKPCFWLASRPDFIEMYCQPGHPAYEICEETCGKCTDYCEDDPKVTFDVDGTMRSCEWLSIRPSKQERFCVKGHEARQMCGETCNFEACEALLEDPSTMGNSKESHRLGGSGGGAGGGGGRSNSTSP